MCMADIQSTAAEIRRGKKDRKKKKKELLNVRFIATWRSKDRAAAYITE